MKLIEGPDKFFKSFLNYIIMPYYTGSDKHTQKQYLQLIRNLVSLFFVKISDDDWINGRKI